MKNLITLCLLLLSIYAKAQKALIVDGNAYNYESVVKTDSVGKSVLYSKGLEWFANNFKNSKTVLQVQDPTGCILIGKGSEISNPEKHEPPYRVEYTIKLEFKDNRLRYTIYDFLSPEYGPLKDGKITQYQIFFGHGMMDRIYKGLQIKTVDIGRALASSIADAFTKQLSAAQKDW
jgi:hypothetical protein